MSPPVRALVALLALLTILGGSAVVAAQSGGPSTAPTADVSSVESFEMSTTMWVELGEGGDAHWNVSMTATLPDQDAVDSFRALATSFEANESDVLSPATFRRYVWLADNSTSRDMALTDVERDATVTDDTGRLELSFTWRNFGLRDGSTVHVRDAFTGPDGLWLQGLTAEQRLVVSVPESFDITSAPKGYTNRTIRWSGPTDFEPADFGITYDVNPPAITTPSQPTTTQPTPSTPTPSTTESTATTAVGPAQGGGVPPAAIVLVVVVLAAAGVYLFRSGGDRLFPASPADTDENGDPATDEQSGDSTASASSMDTDDAAATDETDGEVATGVADAGDDSAVDSGDGAAPIDRELLSDEEYVEALIERNGGRMKQANIVSETDWSNAKVSQLLSAMAEEGRVEKLRIGRENLISFPDDED